MLNRIISNRIKQGEKFFPVVAIDNKSPLNSSKKENEKKKTEINF